MVSLRDFLAVMDGAEVVVHRSCDDDRIIFDTTNLNIHFNGRTYHSLNELYRDIKNPRVVTWTYTEPYLDAGYFEIWCQE